MPNSKHYMDTSKYYTLEQYSDLTGYSKQRLHYYIKTKRILGTKFKYGVRWVPKNANIKPSKAIVGRPLGS